MPPWQVLTLHQQSIGASIGQPIEHMRFVRSQDRTIGDKLCPVFIIAAKAVSYTHLDVYKRQGASFVTLTINGRLRGCIGTLEAYQPLANDVQEHALAAAFRDHRFSPVQMCIRDRFKSYLPV